jgi:multidrug efflux system membrane fusion protein
MNSKYTIKHLLISVFALTFFAITLVSAEEHEAVLDWSKRVELSAPVSGLVQDVFAQAGTIVAKDGVLIQLDQRLFKADLKYAQANLKNMDEHYQEAKRELARQADMYDRTMLSDHDLQIAKNNLVSAQAQLDQAQSSLVKAKLKLEYSAVRAPFDAIVIKTVAVKGQVVAVEIAPPVLVVVAEAHRMLARFYTSAEKLNNFALNQIVKVSIAGNSYQGKISTVALEPIKLNGYAIDVIFEAKDILLRAGQTAKINL